MQEAPQSQLMLKISFLHSAFTLFLILFVVPSFNNLNSHRKRNLGILFAVLIVFSTKFVMIPKPYFSIAVNFRDFFWNFFFFSQLFLFLSVVAWILHTIFGGFEAYRLSIQISKNVIYTKNTLSSFNYERFLLYKSCFSLIYSLF